MSAYRANYIVSVALHDLLYSLWHNSEESWFFRNEKWLMSSQTTSDFLNKTYMIVARAFPFCWVSSLFLGKGIFPPQFWRWLISQWDTSSGIHLHCCFLSCFLSSFAVRFLFLLIPSKQGEENLVCLEPTSVLNLADGLSRITKMNKCWVWESLFLVSLTSHSASCCT